jgi:DNA-binding MurR/RpiR family transcriptional regulator
MQHIAGFSQAIGQCTPTGSYFAQHFSRLGTDTFHDAADNASIVQKMLAKALSRPW